MTICGVAMVPSLLVSASPGLAKRGCKSTRGVSKGWSLSKPSIGISLTSWIVLTTAFNSFADLSVNVACAVIFQIDIVLYCVYLCEFFRIIRPLHQLVVEASNRVLMRQYQSGSVSDIAPYSLHHCGSPFYSRTVPILLLHEPCRP